MPSAVATNVETMLVARFFDGLAGSAFLSVAGGTVGDMFAKTELQAPMMLYTASPFIGPEAGPLLGGFINQFAHWSVLRSTPHPPSPVFFSVSLRSGGCLTSPSPTVTGVGPSTCS